MSDISGHTSRPPFAHYDPDSSSSRTWQVMSLWGWTSYSGTFPRSGMTRGGDAFELPPLVLPMDGSASSSLLPTPAVNDMGAGKTPEDWDAWTAKMQARHGNGNGHGKSLAIEAQRLNGSDHPKEPTGTLPRASRVAGYSPSGTPLLPTPTASDTNGPGAHGEGGADLRTAVSLLPTPRATDGTKGGPNQRGSSGDLMLPSAALLPTPTSTDSHGSRGHRRDGTRYTTTSGVTLTDAAETVARSTGIGEDSMVSTTAPPSGAGTTSPDASPHLFSHLDEADDPS